MISDALRKEIEAIREIGRKERQVNREEFLEWQTADEMRWKALDEESAKRIEEATKKSTDDFMRDLYQKLYGKKTAPPQSAIAQDCATVNLADFSNRDDLTRIMDAMSAKPISSPQPPAQIQHVEKPQEEKSGSFMGRVVQILT